MTEFQIVIHSLLIYYVIEGFHDHTIQKIQDPNNIYGIKKWHRLSFSGNVLVGILFSYLLGDSFWQSLVILLNIGCLRMLVLNSTLNILSKKKIYYLGSISDIDVKLKKYEIEVFIALIILNVFLYYVNV